jgi:aldose 1-epimerase
MSITPLKAAAILATFLFIPMPKTNAQPARPDSVSSKPFGKTPDGKAIQLYTLINSHGMQVNLSTWGATVVNLLAPDRHGHLADVALGFSTTEPYFTQSPYFGATIGRFANRIAKGRFSIGDKVYHLAKNNGLNHLHGGLKGFDKQLWTANVISQNPPTVRFSRLSPDGEEGYPGNLKVTVTFTLSDRDELRMRYTAETDQPTIVNLTNHTYFNLAGAGNGNILGHQVRIHASHYTPVDKTLIPTGEIKSVAGTPMDLRKWTTVGANIEAVGGKPVGFDHNYVLDRCPVVRPALAAEVLDPRSGRLLKVYTDQPGIQFYTGNFLDGTLHGKHGKVYHQHDAFCLETQHFPDSPNHPNFPSTLLKPGQTYRTTTIYKFSAVTDSGAEIKF